MHFHIAQAWYWWNNGPWTLRSPGGTIAVTIYAGVVA